VVLRQLVLRLEELPELLQRLVLPVLVEPRLLE
jgi:hypothetical protein